MGHHWSQEDQEDPVGVVGRDALRISPLVWYNVPKGHIMDDSKNIIVKRTNGERNLHPNAKLPFTDTNGVEHQSVAKAYLSITEGKQYSLKNVLEILFRIIMSQVSQVNEIKALFLASVGKSFIFEAKDPDYFPHEGWGLIKVQGEGKQFHFEGKNLYGILLRRVRDAIINKLNIERVETSSGAVPNGCQPCLRCGGEDVVAGSGYWASVADGSAVGYKHIGPCFDCLPKAQPGVEGTGRGLGYITRSLARKNWTYATHNGTRWNDNHRGIEENLYDPNESNLWRKVPKCSGCGAVGVELFGKSIDDLACKDCLHNNPKNFVTMDEVKIEEENIPL